MIFLSYARADRQTVDPIRKSLEDAGLSVWIDQDAIRGGDRWQMRIVEAIHASEAVAVFLSKNSVKSSAIERELAIAVEAKKRIVPVKLDRSRVPKRFQFQLAGIHRIDWAADPQQGMAELAAALGVARAVEYSPPRRRPGVDALLGGILGFSGGCGLFLLTRFSFGRWDGGEFGLGVGSAAIGAVIGGVVGLSRSHLRAILGTAAIGAAYGALRGWTQSGAEEGLAEGVIGAILGALLGVAVGLVAKWRRRKTEG